MDAIGEAAGDGPADDRGPVRAVLVGELLDRGFDHDVGERAQFIAGLRRAAPDASVILVSPGEPADGYDGRLTGGESARDVMLAIRGECAAAANGPPTAPAGADRRPPSVPTPVSTQQTRAQPAPQEPGAGEQQLMSGAAVGDQPLIAQLTRGHDIVAQAIEMIRQRTADPTVVFVAQREGGQAGACPVLSASNVHLGYLISQRGTEGLEAHARWLAGWMVLARQLAQLRQQAFTDHLTGAWNRRFFDRYMVGAVERARRDRRDLTLLVFDLDDFKPFNDRFGHAAGDLILVETVRLLRSVIRPTDKVARIGGDEFVVIFDDPGGPRDPGSRHPVSVRQIAGRFQSQIRAHKFPSLGIEAPGSLSVSGGIATFPWDGQTPEELLRRADERALESKRSGKNIITIGPDNVDRAP
jgi:diguanylate cyclase (GGDEF)-like protein